MIAAPQTSTWAELDRQKLLTLHDFGKLFDDRLGRAAYGDRGVEQLAREFGCSTRQVYFLRGLAKCWTRPKFEELLELRMPNGRTIPVGHLVQIARLPDPMQRRQLIQLLTRRVLSHRQLASEIRDRQRSGNG